MNPMKISQIQFAAAPPDDAEKGLLGRVQFVLDGRFLVDGVSVRRTLDNRYALSFPAHRDETGDMHHFIRPLDDRTRREVEFAVFRALGYEDGARR